MRRMAVSLFGLEYVHIADVVVAASAAAAARTARIDCSRLHWDGEANAAAYHHDHHDSLVALVEAAASQHDAMY